MAQYNVFLQILPQGENASREEMTEKSFRLDIPDLSGKSVKMALQQKQLVPASCKCCSHKQKQQIDRALTEYEIYIFRSAADSDAGAEYRVTLTPFEDYTLYEDDTCCHSAQTGFLVLRFCTDVSCILQKEQKRTPIKRLQLSECCGRDEQYGDLFREISNLKDLRVLSLRLKPLNSITGELAEFLRNAPRLEILTLDNITPDVLPVLQKMTHLKALRLESYHPDLEHRAASVDFLKDMVSLEYLELVNCDLDAKALTKPSRLKRLNGKIVKKSKNKLI